MSWDSELDDFKRKIDLRQYAVAQGYTLDKRESWRGSPVTASVPRPFFGKWSLIRPHRSRYVGCSPVMALSATGTRGTFTIPASMASIREKSEITHGNNVPSR